MSQQCHLHTTSDQSMDFKSQVQNRKSHVSFPVLSFDRLPVLEGVTTGVLEVVVVAVVVTVRPGAVQDLVVG